MARRLILDALRYFVRTFGADGFRFDLLPLTDPETLRLIATELRKLKPDILLYGEPWAAGKAGIPLGGRTGLARLGFGTVVLRQYHRTGKQHGQQRKKDLQFLHGVRSLSFFS